MKKLIVISLILISLNLPAQDNALPGAESTKVEMADNMRKEGKIYVVVAVVLAILGGLIIYTVAIDRKVTRLEKKLEE